ncbi:MAG TPA: oligosaccharide flippase family protein, partial [bacterium]|nr:oligosaccharide flippase family protein [bacterium]
MSTARTIARNTFFLFLLRASGFVLSFILGMRIGRVLGSEGLGIYTLAVTYLQIFVLIPNFGFDTLAIRDLARDRAHAGRYVANMVFAKVALSLPAYALLIAVVTIFDYPPDTKAAILLLGASLLFDALAEAAAAIFQGF